MDGQPIICQETGLETTSFCVKGDAVQKGACNCRKCRQSFESIASGASTEDEQNKHAEYAKRFPGVERKRRKSVDRYNRGDTALHVLETEWNKMTEGLRSAWQEWVNPPAANKEP